MRLFLLTILQMVHEKVLKLYLIRHGETDFNLQGIVQGGGVDSDLNELGRAQGQAFFEHYKHIPFDTVYCSSLKRTAQTLHPFTELGHELIPCPELNEFNWGVLEGKKSSAESKQMFKEVTEAWATGNLEVGMPEGETPATAWERCKPFFDNLFAEKKEGHVLICSHGRILRIIMSELLGYGMTQMSMFNHDNTGLNVVMITPVGKIYAEKVNDMEHLVKNKVGYSIPSYK